MRKSGIFTISYKYFSMKMMHHQKHIPCMHFRLWVGMVRDEFISCTERHPSMGAPFCCGGPSWLFFKWLLSYLLKRGECFMNFPSSCCDMNSKEGVCLFFRRILRNPPPIPDHLSAEVKDFIRRLLVRDPKKRLGGGHTDSEELKRHKFFKVSHLHFFKYNLRPSYSMHKNSEWESKIFM